MFEHDLDGGRVGRRVRDPPSLDLRAAEVPEEGSGPPRAREKDVPDRGPGAKHIRGGAATEGVPRRGEAEGGAVGAEARLNGGLGAEDTAGRGDPGIGRRTKSGMEGTRAAKDL